MRKQILTTIIGTLISISFVFSLTSLSLIKSVDISAEHIEKAGNLCWVAGARQVNMIDVSDPASPKILESWSTSGTVKSMFASYYLYIAEYSNSVIIKDVSNAKSNEIGYIYPGSQPSDIFVRGKYAYVTDMGTGLSIFDIGDPSAPKKLSTFSNLQLPNGLTVSGNYAYIQNSIQGLTIVDISDPYSPTQAGSYKSSGLIQDLAIDGNNAYLASNGGVTILDISTPANPTKISEIIISKPNAVVVADGHLYIADEFTGLRVFNVSDPMSSLEVAAFTSCGTVKDIVVKDTIAYLADQSKGLHLVDVSEFTTGMSSSNSFTYTISSGWNLVSLPNNPLMSSIYFLFPFITDAYTYLADAGRIKTVSSLETGDGYWVNLTSGSITVTVTGTDFSNYTKTLYPGWNMIGALSNPLLAEAVLSEPAIISELYEYSNASQSYESAEVLAPGKAYWVLVTNTIDLTVSEYPIMGKAIAGRSLTDDEERYYFELYGHTPPAPFEQNNDNNSEASIVVDINVYPNPFHYTLKIDAPAESKVEIYNLQGNKVASLERDATSWIPGSEIESGTYLARINIAGEIFTQKICYLK